MIIFALTVAYNYMHNARIFTQISRLLHCLHEVLVHEECMLSGSAIFVKFMLVVILNIKILQWCFNVLTNLKKEPQGPD